MRISFRLELSSDSRQRSTFRFRAPRNGIMAARVHPLKLSDLKPSTNYPLRNELSEGRCLIHVKLTDLCVKSIEGLMNSEKGAFFSLWFDDNGGTMAIPMSSGGPRKFRFKTAPLRGGEGQGKGNLECVHQAMEPPRQHQLTCMGPLEHRLTVQATDDVYDRTKKLMKEAEEQRKEARAQEIKLVSKGRSKAKAILANAGSGGTPSPAGRKSRPSQQPKFTSPFSGKPLSGKPSMANSGKPSAVNSRSPRSLRDRIIHLLALKPQKRPDIVTRLKKDTKRSESAMSNLDSILSEVSDIQHGTHCLKSHHYSDLNVDSWPFYSEAERQLVKRKVASQPKHSAADTVSSGESLSLPTKRPLSTTAVASTKQIETPPKKAKFSHFPTPPPPQPPPSHSNQQPPPSSQPSPEPPSFAAPTSAPHRPYPPHPLQSSASVQQQQQQQAHKPWTSVSSNPSIRQPSYSQPPAPSVSITQPQPSPSVLKTPAVATSVASLPQSIRDRQLQSFVPASSAAVTNGVTSSSSSLTGSTGLALPSARVPESLKQHMEPVQPVQLDKPVKPEGGEKKRKKEKKKKKEKDKERSQDKHSMPKDPSLVQQSSSGSNHGNQEAAQQSSDRKQPEAAVEQPTCTDASSTSNIPDYISQFPPIESEAQRSEYKRVFNEEYVEYLRIKECMDALKDECAVLSERMSQVSKNSGEAKEVRKKIKEKYTELQESKHQQRFEELHFKLSHIKQLVVDYDKSQPHTASVQ